MFRRRLSLMMIAVKQKMKMLKQTQIPTTRCPTAWAQSSQNQRRAPFSQLTHLKMSSGGYWPWGTQMNEAVLWCRRIRMLRLCGITWIVLVWRSMTSWWGSLIGSFRGMHLRRRRCRSCTSCLISWRERVNSLKGIEKLPIQSIKNLIRYLSIHFLIRSMIFSSRKIRIKAT